MREQEKKNDKESRICLTPKPNQSFFVYRIYKVKKTIFFFIEKVFFKEKVG